MGSPAIADGVSLEAECMQSKQLARIGQSVGFLHTVGRHTEPWHMIIHAGAVKVDVS